MPIVTAFSWYQEAQSFCQGVVESFGIELVWYTVAEHRHGRDAAAEHRDQHLSIPSQPAASQPPKIVSTGTSPESSPKTWTADPHVALSTAEVSATKLSKAPQTYLMPSWSLLEQDPKLWMLLRKNLLANLILTAMTLAYITLTYGLASAPLGPVAAAEPGVSPNVADASGSDFISTISMGSAASLFSRSLGYRLLFWCIRLCAWMLKYVGQWPFYTLLQVIGLVWFSQLYRETWLVRKGWVLRGSSLRTAATSPISPRDRLLGVGEQTVTGSEEQPPLLTRPTATVFASSSAKPWLVRIPLRPQQLATAAEGHWYVVDEVRFSSSYPSWSRALLVLARSVPPYLLHTADVVYRILLHKGPTSPVQDWVIGDASQAAVTANAAAASTLAKARCAVSTSSSAPATDAMSQWPSSVAEGADPFAAVFLQLESISEVLFKALATMSFALFASMMEHLPVIGTPLCLFLNAQLYAFYVFDYRYAAQQQPYGAHRRGSALSYQLRHFEQCWAYYAGYGMGSAALSLWLTHRFGTIISVSVMSVVYSWQVMWSGFAAPLQSIHPVPLFSVWFYAVDTLQKHYAVLWRLLVVVVLLYLPVRCACGIPGLWVRRELPSPCAKGYLLLRGDVNGDAELDTEKSPCTLYRISNPAHPILSAQ